MASGETGCVILNPTGRTAKRDAGARVVAPRRATLDGAVVGLLANGTPQSVEFLDAVYEELSRRYEFAGSLRVLKPGISTPPLQSDMEALVSQATVAVVGMGV